MSCIFSTPNDGTVLTNTATVKNTLGLDFADGRLRFLMRRGSGSCVVTGGEKLAEYSYARGSNTAVVVKVNIVRNAATTVGVARPASTNEAALR